MTLRRERGFTLVELMIVLAILALVAAIAFPRLLNRAPGTSLGAASEELRAALATARSAAIAEDREVWVAGGTGSYRIDGARHDLLSAAGVRIEVPRGRIAFFPSGGSSGGRIVLRGGGSTEQLDIDSLTGRASFAR
jgi:general secretion pathway protein H